MASQDPAVPVTVPLARKRRRILTLFKYILAWIVAPLALIALFELGLRALDYGQSTRLFLKKTLNGRVYWSLNENFYHQFFTGPENARAEYPETLIPAQKAPNAFRIFVFGSSAAQGWIMAEHSFSWILETMFRAKFPGRPIEVYNMAYHGMTSHVMRHIAKACAELEPDLFVVYMGNNEVVGPFGFQLEEGWKARLPIDVKRIVVPEATMWFLGLRLARLIQDPVITVAGGLGFFANVQGTQDPRLPNVYERFARNLEDICRFGHSGGATVAICTMGRNIRDWRPECSSHSAEYFSRQEEWDREYQAGIEREDAGAFDEALKHYGQAAAIDNEYGDLSFRTGRCLWALGQYDPARDAFTRAVEQDCALTGANLRVNEAIRRAASGREDQGVFLVPLAETISDLSEHKIPSSEFFFDNMHLNFEGHYQIARLVFEQTFPALPESMRQAAVGGPAPLDAAACARRLALTPAKRLDEYRTAFNQPNMWKNQPTGHLAKAIADLEQQAGPNSGEQLANGYIEAAALDPDNYTVGFHAIEFQMGRSAPDDAVKAAQAFADRFPDRRLAQRLLANALARKGRTDEAIEQLRKAVAMNPDDFGAYVQLGGMLDQAGRLDEALHAYRQALHSKPYFDPARGGFIQVIAKQGDFPRALAACRRMPGLPNQPISSFSNSFGAAASTFEYQQNWAKAVEGYRAALEVDPDNAGYRTNLGNALLGQGEYEEARRVLEDVIAQHPDLRNAYDSLDQAFLRKNDLPARAAYWGAFTEHHPDLAPGWVHLGLAREGVHDAPGAIAAYERARALDPKNVNVLLQLGSVCDQAERRDEAMGFFREALDLNPGDYSTYQQIDSIYARRNDLDGRVKEWQAATERHPEAAAAFFHLAQALEEKNEVDRAIAAYQKALEIDPSGAFTRGNLGRLQARNGQFEEAITSLRSALQSRPDIQGLRPILIKALCETRQYDAAWDEVKQCQEKGETVPPDLLERLQRDSGRAG